MSDKRNHLAVAATNERASLVLAAAGYGGWSITTMFYAALHLVEAFLSDQGIHSTTHARRELTIRTDNRLQLLYNLYRQPKRDSLEARYECKAFSAADVQRLHDAYFAPLKRELTKLLAG